MRAASAVDVATFVEVVDQGRVVSYEIGAGKRLAIEESEWLDDWFMSASPRNGNSNAEERAGGVMKALTVRQPWASLIAAGVKTIETRSWSTKYRGPLAIHAGAHRPTEGEELCGDSGWYWEWDVDHGIVIIGREPWNEHPAPLGAVVATCTLADVLPITTYADIGDPECIVNHCDGTIDHAIPSDDDQPITVDPPGVTVVHLDALEIPDGVHLIREVNDQLPFGDFTPGRHAWLLTDITPLPEPVPAKGRRGLWDWEADR